MARKNTYPLTLNIMQGVLTSLSQLARRQFAHAKRPFTFSELMQLFVPAEHREVLKGAYEIAAPPGISLDIYAGMPICNGTTKRFILNFEWSTSSYPDGFFPLKSDPNHPAQLVDDCPEELAAEWKRVLADMYDISYNFGRAQYVLEKLNDKKFCRTPMAVRMFWRCLVPLLKMRTGAKECLSLAAQLDTFQPKLLYNPSIPADLSADDIRETNDYVLRAMLVDPINPQKLPVPYRIWPEPEFGSFVGFVDM